MSDEQVEQGAASSAGTTGAEKPRSERKTARGIVMSNKMDKTQEAWWDLEIPWMALL